MGMFNNDYYFNGVKQYGGRPAIIIKKKNPKANSTGVKNGNSQYVSGNNSQNKSNKLTSGGPIKKDATEKSISPNSRRLKIETEPRIVEIKSNSEPKAPIEDDSLKLVPKIKQGSDKNDSSSSHPKKQSTSDNLQISDFQVLTDKIFDVVSCLGKNKIPVQPMVLELTNLAMAIDYDKLFTNKTPTPEGPGHSKKYFVTTMLAVAGALGSGDSTASETIHKLTNLAAWLASPPPKATATVIKPGKGKDLDAAKPSGPEPTDADKTKTKDKKKQPERGAEDSEVKATSEGSGKGSPLASGGDEKKNAKEDAKPATQGKEDLVPPAPGSEGVKPPAPGKTGAPDAGVASAKGAVPIASGGANTAPKTEAPKPLLLSDVQGQQTPRGGETDHRREIDYLNLAQLQAQFTGQPTPPNGKIGNHHNFGYLNLPQPQTQLPVQLTPRIPDTANHYDPRYPHLSHPQTQFSGQLGHPAFQEMYRNVPQIQAQFLGQPTPQIDEMRNHSGLKSRNVPQTQAQFLGQPTSQIDEMGNHSELKYRNVPQTQAQFLGQPTPQIGGMGNYAELKNRNVSQTQAQFLGQPTRQIAEEYIVSEYGAYTGAESHNVVQPQRTQQAGEFGSVDEYSRFHSTKPQDRPPFPTQQPAQGYVNVREIKPNLSVPLTDTSGDTTGPAFYQSQRPADGRHPYAGSARQAHSSDRKPNRPKSKLPGSYDQDEFSDSSGSFPSSESEWESTRETNRGPNEQDRLNNRGGHDTRRSRHESPESQKCGRVGWCREESSGEDIRRGGPRRNGSRRDESSWENVRRGRRHRKESNREYASRGGSHREGHLRDGSCSRENRAEESYREKEYQSRRDNKHTKTDHAEDLQTTTSKKLPTGSEKTRSWAEYFLQHTPNKINSSTCKHNRN